MKTLQDVLEYKIDGTLWWKERVNNACRMDKPVGNPRHHGHLGFKLWNKSRFVHRVVWEMFNGPIPNGFEIDHINRNPSDNRIENLRLCTSSQNKCNTGTREDNTSGFKGVSFHKASGKWRTSVTYEGITHHLGYFDDPQQAATAYKRKAIELFGNFAAQECL